MDPLACMRIFVRVVEHGAFVRAADDLGISPSSATTAVNRLERRLGTRLLNRTTRRLSLTDEGRGYYEDCVRILAEIVEAEDRLSSARHSPRGLLRVSIPHSFIPFSFFPALKEFLEACPHLSVEVIVSDRTVNLVEEGIDCALRSAEIPEDSGLVVRQLARARLLTCASPDYLLRHGTPRSVDDLAGHNCIRFISPSTGRARDWVFAEDGALRSYQPAGNIRVSALDAAAAAAVAGAGIAQVPDAVAFEAIMNGQLTPLLTGNTVRAVPLLLVYPGNRYQPAKLRAFVAHFSKVYPADGWWPSIAERIGAPDGPAA